MDADSAYDLALERLGDAISDLERNLPYRREAANVVRSLPDRCRTRPARNIRDGGAGEEYIRAGDIFQVVPSHRLSVPFELPPFSLYRALRRLNPCLSCCIWTSATVSASSAPAWRSWSGCATAR